MKQLTRQDIKDVLKEGGMVTKDNFGDLLKGYGVVTKDNFGSLLKGLGIATKRDLVDFVTKKDLTLLEKKMATKRNLNKVKKELLTAIGNIAVNSPTFGQFKTLEKRVSDLEPIVA